MNHPKSQIQTILDARGSTYGDFSDHAVISQNLQDAMRAAPGFHNLDPAKKQALSVIADKIARILNGDPNYADSWIDIIGYTKLVIDRLPK